MHEFIKTIKSSEVLESKDFAIIEKNEKELEKAHDTNQHYRTETEMKGSVLAKFPSDEGKFWQCVREETMMFENLTANSIDFMIKSGELELLEIELSEFDDSIIHKAKKKIKNGEIQMKQLQILKVQQEAHYRAVEIKHWEKIKKKLAKNIKAELMEDVELHQKESYKKKWEKEISLGHNIYNNTVNLKALQEDG
tara:strand:- start:181 stop:765 length:585 start_codon:yes stop_codon:yes gene_type:complete